MVEERKASSAAKRLKSNSNVTPLPHTSGPQLLSNQPSIGDLLSPLSDCLDLWSSNSHPPSSSEATVLSQTSVTIPPVISKTSHQGPMRSSQTGTTLLPSSVPSFSQFGFSNSLMFDSLDNAIEPRPAIAESSAISPFSGAPDNYELAGNTYQSVPGPPALQPMSSSSQSASASTSASNRLVGNEQELSIDLDSLQNSPKIVQPEQEVNAGSEFIVSSHGSASSAGNSYSIEQEIQPQVRRATSHEKVLSSSDMQPHPVQQDSSVSTASNGLEDPVDTLNGQEKPGNTSSTLNLKVIDSDQAQRRSNACKRCNQKKIRCDKILPSW